MKFTFRSGFSALLILLLFTFQATDVAAQEITVSSLTEEFNSTIEKANEDPAGTLDKLKTVIENAETLGEEGNEIKSLAESKLPALNYKIAYSYYEEKDYENAAAAFQKTKEVADRVGDEDVSKQAGSVLPQIYYAYGSTLLKEKDFEGALEQYTKSKEANPEYDNAYYGMARAYRYLKDYDNLIVYTDMAIEKGDAKTKKGAINNVSNAFYSKAKSSIKKKQYSDAVEALKIAMKYDAEDDQSRYHFQMGKALAGLGQSSEACASYKKVTDSKLKEAADYEIQYTLKCG